MKGLGERLKLLRNEKELSQKELARILKIGRSAIALYETNARQPDPETLKLLADHFNVSIDWILGRTMEKAGYLSPVIGESSPPYDIRDPSRHPSKQNLPTEITAEENEFLESFRKLEKKDRRTLKIIADQLDDKDSQAATME